MIFSKNISKNLWPEAIAYACYIKNRSPTHALGGNTTPHEAFFNKRTNISRLQEFGTKCWIMVPDQHSAPHWTQKWKSIYSQELPKMLKHGNITIPIQK